MFKERLFDMMESKVFAYLRVSGKGQLNGNGFDRQLENIESFCKRKGYSIEQIFREQVSGTKDEADREQFEAQIALEEGDVASADNRAYQAMLKAAALWSRPSGWTSPAWEGLGSYYPTRAYSCRRVPGPSCAGDRVGSACDCPAGVAAAA